MPSRTKKPFYKRHPWVEWLKGPKGKTYQLKKGEDYTCMTHSMVSQIRNKAGAWKIQVSIQVEEIQGKEIIWLTVRGN